MQPLPICQYLEFFAFNYFQIGLREVLLHIQTISTFHTASNFDVCFLAFGNPIKISSMRTGFHL